VLFQTFFDGTQKKVAKQFWFGDFSQNVFLLVLCSAEIIHTSLELGVNEDRNTSHCVKYQLVS